MDTPTQVLTLEEPFRLFQDPDGYGIVEVPFSNGSKVLMHVSQWEAIAHEVASNSKLQSAILATHKQRVEVSRLLEGRERLRQATDRQKIS